MAIDLTTTGIHHLSLRCLDMEVTKNFYQNILGLQLVMDTPQIIIFSVGKVSVAFLQANPRDSNYSTFSPFEIGLDHMAMTCESEEELHRVAAALTDEGVENTGVKLDETLNKLYVAFKDPDRIQWEFYMQ